MSDHYTKYLSGKLDGLAQSGRWTVGRKAALVALIRRGDLTLAAASRRYAVPVDELANWMRRDAAHGASGLAIGKLQEVGRS